ncbi:MAG: phage tail tape measure protein [Mesorhizobium sp.]|nr:MAG: phage tail tape measure protein [Mesorhizobium sp.]
MSNRTIEAVMRLSAKLGPMGAFGQLGSKLDQVNRKATAFNKAQTSINRAMSAMPVGRFVGPAAAGYFGVQAVKQFAETERRLTRIGTVLGANQGEMDDLYASLGKSAKRYGLLSEDLVQIAETYAAAGADLRDVQSNTDLLAKATLAIGSSGEDTVRALDAARKSLKLTTPEYEKFFEIIAAGSSVGKFEGRDMAQFLPGLLPSAAKQGMQGLGGATNIVAFLEVMADYAGDAGQAATAVGDFLEKISSPDVEKRLGKISGKFAKDIKNARDNGGDMLETMHKILTEATGGKADRLGQIFGDKEARAAATVILTKMDQIRAAQREISANAPDVLDRNNKRLLDDTTAALNRIEDTYNRLVGASGKFVVNTGLVDWVDNFASNVDQASEDIKRMSAAVKGGWTPGDSLAALASGGDPSAVVDDYAARGGYVTPQMRRIIEANRAYRGTGRTRVPTFDTGIDPSGVPYPRRYDPGEYSDYGQLRPRGLDGVPPDLMTRRDRGSAIGAQLDSGSDPNYSEFLSAASHAGDEVAKSVSDGVAKGGQQAGNIFATMIAGMGKQLAAEFNANVRPVPIAQPSVRADTGRSDAGRMMGPR